MCPAGRRRRRHPTAPPPPITPACSFKPYSLTERKARAATRNQPWGPTGSELARLSELSFSPADCATILHVVDLRLSYPPKKVCGPVGREAAEGCAGHGRRSWSAAAAIQAPPAAIQAPLLARRQRGQPRPSLPRLAPPPSAHAAALPALPLQWRNVYKGLTLLEYLLRHGSEPCVARARGALVPRLDSLAAAFTCVEANGRDSGANVRHR